MIKYTVHKDQHDFTPRDFNIFWNKSKIEYKVIFDSSCRYKIKAQDQKNKLFGIGYFSWFNSISHTDSARFTFYYDPYIDKIKIYSYCYIDKERVENFICNCNLNVTYKFKLGISLDKYHFAVFEENSILNIGYSQVNFNHIKKLGFLLSPYFGGQDVAPNDVVVYMEKD